MAIINTKLIKYATQARFDIDIAKVPAVIDSKSIVFVEDTGRIYAHGKYFGGAWEDITDKPKTFAPSAHKHGPITNDGKIGTSADRIIETTTGGLLTHVAKNTAYNRAFGTGENQVARGNHTHPNFTRTVAGLVPAPGADTTTRYLREDGTWVTPPNTADTHWVTGVFVGAVTTKTDTAVTNPYIKIFDNNTNRGNVQIIGGTNVNVKSDALKAITITATDTTYSAGNYMTIADGNKITGNYGLLTKALLDGGKDATYRVTTAAQMHAWIEGKNFSTESFVNNAIEGLEIGGRNLIIRSSEEVGTWVSLSGDIVTSANHSTTDYIKVEPSNTYSLSKIPSVLVTAGISGYWRYAWYDEDKVYISRRAETSLHNLQWTIPSNAHYVRLSYPIDSQPKFEKGNKPTDWTPAPEDQVSDWLTTDVNSFSYIKNKPTKLSEFSNDLGNYGNWITKAQGDSYYAPISHSNITGANTIHHTHGNWANLNGINQALATTSSPTFKAVTLGTIYSTGDVSVLNGGSAQRILTGGLLASNAYADASKIPANGIYSRGKIDTLSHGDSSQWNTAYGWGNHASGGYVKKIGDTMSGSLTATSFVKSGVTTPQNYLLQADGGHILKSSFSGSTHNHALKLIAGTSTATTNSTTDVADPYIRLFSDNVHQGNIRIVGGTNVGAVSKNGVITLTATDTKYTAGSNITINSSNVIAGNYPSLTKANLDTGTATTQSVATPQVLASWLSGKNYATVGYVDELEIGGRNYVDYRLVGRYSGGTVSTQNSITENSKYNHSTNGAPRDLMGFISHPLGKGHITISCKSGLDAFNVYYNIKYSNGTQTGQKSLGRKILIDGVFNLTIDNPEDNGILHIGLGQFPFVEDYWIADVKFEKGNKATDWTPAPEDQVSDWLTTDADSFSFIKNKPTKLTLTGAVTGNTTLSSGELSLNTSLTAHTHTWAQITGTIPTWNQSTTGNAATASAVSTSADNSNATSRYILFANNASGNQALKTDTGLKYVPSTNTISANFSGDLTGNVTGNSDTATALKNINTTFTGEYPLTVNVSGTIYSHTGMTYKGSTGELKASKFVGALTGNASTATTATNATNINTVADNSSNAARFILFSDAATGNQRAKTDTGLKYNPSSNTITAALAGNASTATALTTSAGSATRPIYFSNGKPVQGTYIFGNASGNAPISNGVVNVNLNAAMLAGYTPSSFLLSRRMENPSDGTSEQGAIPFILALKAAGRPVYTDPEFSSGNGNVSVYNNGTQGTVSITRVSNTSAANSSGYVLEIATTSGAAAPGRGGFYQSISARANAVFCQIFRAKIPVGFSVNNAENSMGTGSTTHWLTDKAGTGKWEWYCRVTICGPTGTFSGGGHVYLVGSGAVTWQLAYCNVIDLSKGEYDGLRTRFADSADTATALTTSAGSATQPVYFSGGKPVAATTYANASVKYATSAGTATSAGSAAKLGTATVGSTQLPIYLNAGTATAITQANLRKGLFGTTAIGSSTKPVYIDTNGVPTASTSFGGVTGIGTANPLVDGTVAAGTSTLAARQDHRHPVDTSRAPLSNPTFTGNVIAPKIFINKAGNVASGISWHNSTYNAWQDYMANSTTTGNGVKANITAPSGTLVTAWARRSFIENSAGFGWTFESGANSSITPSIVAEIRASDGAAKFTGNVTAPTFSGNLTIGDWSLLTEASGTRFTIKHGGADKMSISTSGSGVVDFYSDLFIQDNLTAGSIFSENDVRAYELIAYETVTAPTFIGALSGNATTATTADKLNITSTTSGVWIDMLGNIGDTVYNAASGKLTMHPYTGNISTQGNITSNGVDSSGVHSFSGPNGKWSSPGVILAFTKSLSNWTGTTYSFDQLWKIGDINPYAVRSGRNITVYHHLGHTNYMAMGTINAGSAVITHVSSSDVSCVLTIEGNYATTHKVNIVIFGNNA